MQTCFALSGRLFELCNQPRASPSEISKKFRRADMLRPFRPMPCPEYPEESVWAILDSSDSFCSPSPPLLPLRERVFSTKPEKCCCSLSLRERRGGRQIQPHIPFPLCSLSLRERGGVRGKVNIIERLSQRTAYYLRQCKKCCCFKPFFIFGPVNRYVMDIPIP